MLDCSSERVVNCLQKAAAARERALQAGDPVARRFHFEMEQRWSRLADSNAYVERVERMLSSLPRSDSSDSTW